MGGALPAGLLLAALGCLLSFADRRSIALGVLLAAAGAGALAWSGPFDADLREPIVAFGAAVTVLIAAGVHLRSGPKRMTAAAAALIVGLTAGAMIAAAGRPADLALASPALLLAVPGRLLVERRCGVAVKVLAGWITAVALLSLALAVVVPTPGYEPDHME